MPTKAELKEEIEKIKLSLQNLLETAPEFPINYDDKVLAIEQYFKPAYEQFLTDLKALV